MTKEKLEKHILTYIGLLDAQVCSEGTWSEAMKWIRIYNMAGTSNNWTKDKGGKYKPVTCTKYPERTHYMFLC